MSTPQRIPNYTLASPEEVPSWDFVQRWIPGVWELIGVTAVYSGSWRNAGASGIAGARWRRNGDSVEFSGLVDNSGGNFVANDPIVTLPPEVRVVGPAGAQEYYEGALTFGGIVGMSWMIYNPGTGVLRFAGGATPGLTNPVGWISLTGLRFPIV